MPACRICGARPAAEGRGACDECRSGCLLAGMCAECGEPPGEGEDCDVCAQVRAGRNRAPAPTLRFGQRVSGVAIARPPIVREKPRNVVPPPARSAPPATPKPEPKEKAMSFACRNPRKNPKCLGTVSREGGLCRSCGILSARAARRGAAEPDAPEAPPKPADPDLAPAAAKPPDAPPATAAVPMAPILKAPGTLVARGAGPVTAALCDLVEEAARLAGTGGEVDARLSFRRGRLVIGVEVEGAAVSTRPRTDSEN